MFSILTPFPFLLDFSFFAPLLLRLTLGLYVLAIGFSAIHKNVPAEVKPELTPLQMIFRALFIIAGISLIIGLYLQISAIVVAILMLSALADKRARLTTELGRTELSLLLVIALSLIVMGAGPFAFDLPL
jgi:uncharacterized membrane protein YphA (DoxX/SURF4 family)